MTDYYPVTDWAERFTGALLQGANRARLEDRGDLIEPYVRAAVTPLIAEVRADWQNQIADAIDNAEFGEWCNCNRREDASAVARGFGDTS